MVSATNKRGNKRIFLIKMEEMNEILKIWKLWAQ
jgi:hypothetical protein